MPSLPSSRTARRLFKLASLGFAGLLAGLLTGCNAWPVDAVNEGTNQHISGDWEFTPATTPDAHPLSLPESIDARETPALHHSPSARRLQYGSLAPTPQAATPRYSDHS